MKRSVMFAGIVLAVVVIIITFRFNLQKYVIIVATAAGGAAVIVGTFMYGIAGLAVADLGANPIRSALSDSFWWSIFWIALVVMGIIVQLQANRAYEIEPYDNRI